MRSDLEGMAVTDRKAVSFADKTSTEVRSTDRTVFNFTDKAGPTDRLAIEARVSVPEEEVERSRSRLPIDRGWSWIIMAGHFVLSLVMMGYGRALSIFLMEFVVMFEASVATAMLSFAAMTAGFGLGNVLVTHVLLPRFDTRHVIVTGTTVGSLAIALSSFAPNITVIILAQSVIGLCNAMMHTSSSTLMGPYFRSRRGLANAVANTGVSVSALVFPPLTQFLITSYGTRGALLLVGGMQMQAVVAACLMRSVEFYDKKGRSLVNRKRKALRENGGEIQLEGLCSERSLTQGCSELDEKEKALQHHCPSASELHRECRCFRSEERESLTGSVPLLSNSDDKKLQLDSIQRKGFDENSELKGQTETIEPFSSKTVLPVAGRYENICLSNIEKNQEEHRFLIGVAKEASSSSEAFLGEQLTSEKDGISTRPSLQYDRSEKAGQDEGPSSDHVPESSEDRCQPSTIFMTPTFDSSMDHSRTVKSSNGDTRCCGCVSLTSKLIDLTLLRNWLFLLIATYVPLGLTNSFLGVFLPSLGVEMGLSRPDAALLLTVMGGVDLFSRLAMGYLADTGHVRRTHIVAMALAILSVSCMFASFYRDFWRLVVFCVMFGLCGGTCQNLLVVVIIDLLGLDNLSKALGLVMMVNSLCLTLTHPLLGALVDWTGSYVVTYHYVGVCLSLAVLILLMEPLARKLEIRRMRRLEAARNGSEGLG